MGVRHGGQGVDREQQEEGQGEVASLGVGVREEDPVILEEGLRGYLHRLKYC